MFATSILENKELIWKLNEGGVVVMPTDTLYGIVGKAENAETVERIYQTRRRTPTKPCIILIGEINQVQKFGVVLSLKQKEEIKNYWPGPVSIILDCREDGTSYLHRGTQTLAFRMPQDENLRMFLLQTGPLIAPSANIEGQPPAKNIKEAREYFGEAVDFYLDGGNIEGKASKVIRLLENGDIEVIRQ